MTASAEASTTGRGRILMFTRDQRIDRRILLQADALEADGWAVSILAVPARDLVASDDRRVTRLAQGSSDNPSSTISRSLWHAYQALGRLLPVNSRWMMTARALGLSLYRGGPEVLVLRLFASEIERSLADIYVAHDLPVLPVAVASSQAHGGKVVYDSHELFTEQELSWVEKRLWRRMETRYIGQVDLVTTINPSIAHELEIRYKIPSVEVIYNAERVGQLVRRGRLFHKRLGLPPQARILLYQGGLSEGRNLDALVRMLPFLRIPDLHMVFLGDGILAPRLAHLAAKLGMASRAHLMPAVPQHRLLEHTASADAGVIPYRATCLNNYYCTPNKLFELIAAGTPVVATDLPELRRLVAQNRIGLVGNTNTPEDLAELVDEMFRPPDGPERFRNAVLETRKRVNWQEESKKLVQAYRGLAVHDKAGNRCPPVR